MDETPKLITDYADILARDAFDADAHVTVETFKDVTGKYVFRDKVKRPCQTLKPTGRCGRMHFDGFLVMNTEGQETLVGSTCGPSYFHADERFSEGARRIERAIALADTLARLNEIVTDRAALENTITDELSRVRRFREHIQAFSAGLPSDVAQALSNMARTGSTRVTIEVQYIEKDENGKTVSTEWVEAPVGSVMHTRLFLDYVGVEAIDLLKAARTAVSEVVVEKSAGLRKLQRWLAALSPVPDAMAQIDSLEQQFSEFETASNIQPLIFISGNVNHRLKIAELVLKLRGEDKSGAASYLRELEAATRKSHGGRNFRPSK